MEALDVARFPDRFDHLAGAVDDGGDAQHVARPLGVFDVAAEDHVAVTALGQLAHGSGLWPGDLQGDVELGLPVAIDVAAEGELVKQQDV